MAKRHSTVPKAPPLGPRLQEARKQRRLTLERLASLSGISKSMLSQIERGLANPTFATLWNISHALGLEIGSLIGTAESEATSTTRVETMSAHYTPTIRSADGRCLLRILSPVEAASRVEWYKLEMECKGLLESQPHAVGTVEHLTCLEGAIRVVSGEGEQLLAKGDTARYPGDVDHLIENAGNADAHGLLVVLYSV